MPLLSYGWPPVNARHVAGSPTNAVDPSGQFLDVIVDVGFIVWDVVDIAVNGANDENVAALGADVASALIPFATGGGLLVRGAAHADDVVRAVSYADDAADAGNALIYRSGKPNPGNLTPRSGEDGLSFRDSLSNPWPLPKGQRPVFQPGDDYIAVDTSRLPRGSVVYDNVPPGHVTVCNVDAGTLKLAVVERGKFPK